MSMSNEPRLQSFVERVERLNTEISGLNEDRQAVFGEAKEAGFSTKIMRAIIKERQIGPDDFAELERMKQIYREQLGMLAELPLGQAALRRRDKADGAPVAATA
jgi:uncharacterized protein (UPF0335 family)